MISKAKLKEQIDKIPEDEISIDELIERLIFIEKLEKRIASSKRGETLSEEQAEKEMRSWFRSNGKPSLGRSQ
jgi:flagellar biosynthesis chaperone FliJ